MLYQVFLRQKLIRWYETIVYVANNILYYIIAFQVFVSRRYDYFCYFAQIGVQKNYEILCKAFDNEAKATLEA